MPSVTVLQLDTHFPRIPGDVACPATYRDEIEVIRIPRAFVAQVVTGDPSTFDVTPFVDAVKTARGDVIVTSCGFLAPFQDEIAVQTQRPFFASAIGQYADLLSDHWLEGLQLMTFDAVALRQMLITFMPEEYICGLIGLPETSHLRQVIANDANRLDPARAATEIAALWDAQSTDTVQHLLLECTNLPPYKPALRKVLDVPITDILTVIEAARPRTVAPAFL